MSNERLVDNNVNGPSPCVEAQIHSYLFLLVASLLGCSTDDNTGAAIPEAEAPSGDPRSDNIICFETTLVGVTVEDGVSLGIQPVEGEAGKPGVLTRRDGRNMALLPSSNGRGKLWAPGVEHQVRWSFSGGRCTILAE